MSKAFSFLLAFLFLAIASAFAQFTLLYQKDGAATDDWLGFSVASAGDVNGDGKADFIIGAYSASPGGLSDAGSAYVYSGVDGSLLFQKDGTADFDKMGFSVASAGDVNGDGRDDFIIGAPLADPGGLSNAGSVYVYSGADGSLLYQKNGADDDNLGSSVASAGDVDGDGRADFIIGTPYTNLGTVFDVGSAYIYSGADGSLIYQKNGTAANDWLGWSVASAGDVNGDGRADFIIGAPGASPGGIIGAGSAYVYSGADGSLLYQKNGAAATDNLGGSVASAGDVDGDGRADFIIGADHASPDGIIGAGSAYVYSGATGALLYQKNGTAADYRLGFSVASAGDVNGDGRADFIIGAYFSGPSWAGSAYLYSGANGSLLCQVNGAADDEWLGYSVASAGDMNDDGRTDLIIGAPRADPGGLPNAGSAYVYSCCTSCANAKGDMNGDGGLTPADVVLLLQCIFLQIGTCDPCYTDIDGNGSLTPADAVLMLNAVFLGAPLPC